MTLLAAFGFLVLPFIISIPLAFCLGWGRVAVRKSRANRNLKGREPRRTLRRDGARNRVVAFAKRLMQARPKPDPHDPRERLIEELRVLRGQGDDLPGNPGDDGIVLSARGGPVSDSRLR